MAPDKEDVASVRSTVKTEGTLVRDEIERLNASQCRFKGEDGFFVTKAKLGELEDRLHELMKTGDTKQDPHLLIELNERLVQITERAQRAEYARDAALERANALSGDMVTISKALDQQRLVSETEKSLINKDKKKLTAQLQDAQAALKAATYGKTADPDEVRELKNKVTLVQRELQEKNTAYALEQSKVQSLISQLSQKEKEVEHEKAVAKRSEAAMLAKSALTDLRPPTPLGEIKLDPDIDSAILKKVYTGEDLRRLNEIAKAKRESVRQYAYQLMELASSQDPKNFVGYKDTARVLFMKVKSTTGKKRAKYLGVLDSLFASMTTRTGPKLKEIHKEFQSVFAPTRDDIEKEKEKVRSGSYSWWTGFKWDLRLSRLEFKIRFRQFKRSLSEKIGSLRSSLSSFFSFSFTSFRG